MTDEKLLKKQLRKDRYLSELEKKRFEEFRKSIIEISKTIDKYFYSKI